MALELVGGVGVEPVVPVLDGAVVEHDLVVGDGCQIHGREATGTAESRPSSHELSRIRP